MAVDENVIDDEAEDDLPAQTEDRDRELATDKSIRKTCLKIYPDLLKGFADQWERSNAQMDYWEVYNCILNGKQFYSGNSKIYLPLCHDAINARTTRFVNQIFPQNGKHIEVIASEDKPSALMSLLEFYIRKAKLRTNVMPALLRNGDVEGQYNLYVKWVRRKRNVAMRVNRKRTVDDMEIPDDDGYDDIEQQEIVHQYPAFEVIADADVLILPFTCSSVEEAMAEGGSVTIVRRWSKNKIRSLVRSGEFSREAGEDLLEAMANKTTTDHPNKQANMIDAAGIKFEGGGKVTALVYETWHVIKVDGEYRTVRSYFGGEDRLISCKLNPYWCDKVPLISSPVDKIQGSFKGLSKLKFIDSVQYAANDAINEGMDSAAYALLPIIMTDPEKNPRVGSMVLNVAAIWETSPKDTQFAQFPQLWKEAFAIVSSCKEQIFQTLGVNPAMLPHQLTQGTKKPNQAQIAAEQQVDLLTTADVVTGLEGNVLTPVLQWMVWLDHQYRDTEMLIPSFGELGVKMEMDKIAPIQMDRRFEFRWYGVEQARSMQQMQIQMAGLNVLKQIPPQAIPGKRIDIAPIIENWIQTIYGPRVAGQVFKDIRAELTLDPQFENRILESGMPMSVHPLDDDVQHLQEHMKAFAENGDFTGFLRDHMMGHQMQMQQKKQAQMMAAAQAQMQPQQPPGGQRGAPRQGAKTAGPRPMGQQPPGAVSHDNLPMAMPRPRRGMM